jgi:hypothetical protein
MGLPLERAHKLKHWTAVAEEEPEGRMSFSLLVPPRARSYLARELRLLPEARLLAFWRIHRVIEDLSKV